MPYRANQNSFAGGLASPYLHARSDLSKYRSLLATASNCIVMAHGGIVKAPGTQFIAELEDSMTSGVLAPFSFNTEQEYILEFTDGSMRVIKDDGLVLDTSETKAISSITQANPGVLQTSASHNLSLGDVVYIDGGDMIELTGFFCVRSTPAANQLTLKDRFGVAIDTTDFTAYTTGGEVDIPYKNGSSPYSAADLDRVVYAQEADIMYMTHRSYDIRKLSRTNHDVWTFSIPDFVPDTEAPANPAAVATVGSGTETYTYKIAAIDEDTGEESLPSSEATVTNDLSVSGNKNTVSWDAVDGASRYIVYKEDNGVFGYIGGTEDLSFVDENIVPDLADTPQSSRNPFAGVDNKPGCVSFFEQRLFLASSNNDPNKVWASGSTSYENMSRSQPTKASDAIEFAIRAKQVNEIRAIVPLQELLLMTSAAEYLVKAGEEGFLTPTNPVVRPQSYRGNSRVQPLLIGNQLIYNYARGGVVRDFGYEFATDGYNGNDLTILARHLFEGRSIKAWAYQQVPDSLVWVILDDGSLLTLSYVREHEVWAWTEHERNGATFESVAVIGGETEDEVYFIVKRTINGQTKRYVEKLHSRFFSEDDQADAFYVDCGLSFTGTATSLSGLGHLEGEDVVALIDGEVHKNLTITNGVLTDADGNTTFDVTSQAHVGLNYTATVRTLKLDLTALAGELGTTFGRRVDVAGVHLYLYKTRGVKAGPNAANLDKMVIRDQEDWGEPTDPLSGIAEIEIEGDWYGGGQVTVVQDNPLPMHLLAIMPDIVLGE